MQQKRFNWIWRGILLMFGAPPQQGGFGQGGGQGGRTDFYTRINDLLAWNTEGVSCGFIAGILPSGSAGPDNNPVSDADFQTAVAGYGNPPLGAITAATFGAMVTALQTLAADWQAALSVVTACKP